MTTTPTHHHTSPGPLVPLAIWPVAQTDPRRQRAGRYHPDSTAHPGKMLPDLARRIITEYSTPGQLVVDAMAGTGTTVVEAALAGRRAVGVELESRWAKVAVANLDLAVAADRRRLAKVTVGDARQLADLLGPLAGRVDLIVMSPPYACDTRVIDRPAFVAGGRIGRSDGMNYSCDRANVGHARGAAYEKAMAEIYTACYQVLRPGGRLVVVTKNTRSKGRTLDLAGLTVALGRAAGFTYLQHVIALHTAIRDGELVARPSFWQATNTRHLRQRGEAVHVVVHEDVIVLVRSEAADGH